MKKEQQSRPNAPSQHGERLLGVDLIDHVVEPTGPAGSNVGLHDGNKLVSIDLGDATGTTSTGGGKGRRCLDIVILVAAAKVGPVVGRGAGGGMVGIASGLGPLGVGGRCGEDAIDGPSVQTAQDGHDLAEGFVGAVDPHNVAMLQALSVLVETGVDRLVVVVVGGDDVGLELEQTGEAPVPAIVAGKLVLEFGGQCDGLGMNGGVERPGEEQVQIDLELVVVLRTGEVVGSTGPVGVPKAEGLLEIGGVVGSKGPDNRHATLADGLDGEGVAGGGGRCGILLAIL